MESILASLAVEPQPSHLPCPTNDCRHCGGVLEEMGHPLPTYIPDSVVKYPPTYADQRGARIQ